jgi:hypothetical protein
MEISRMMNQHPNVEVLMRKKRKRKSCPGQLPLDFETKPTPVPSTPADEAHNEPAAAPQSCWRRFFAKADGLVKYINLIINLSGRFESEG